MASASRSGELVLSIDSKTLRGTVAGTTLDCRVRLGVGLGARLTSGEYRFSRPTKHPTMGTVACATLISTGSCGSLLHGGFGPTDVHGRGRGVHGLEAPPLQRGEPGSVMYNPDRVQIDKNVPWQDDSEGGPAKGETDVLLWTGVGSPGTVLFAAPSVGGWNSVAVLTGFDPLIRALTLSAGCALIVGR